MQKNQPVFEVYEHQIHLDEILSQLDMKELMSLVKHHKIPKCSQLRKRELIVKISQFILDETVFKNFFLCLNDEEIDSLRLAQIYNGIIEDAEPEAFSFLMYGGYAGFTKGLIFAIPIEVMNIFGQIDTQAFEQYRKRMVSIGDYCHVANDLYGVTPPMQIVKMFNLYEKKKTDWDEVMKAYHIFARYRCDFAYIDVYFVDKIFINSYSELFETQGNIPYYMPSYEQICEWSRYGILPDSSDVLALYNYMVDKMWVDGEKAADTCFAISHTVRFGCQLKSLTDELTHQGIYFQSKRQEKELSALLTHLWNQSRMILYRGFSPRDLGQIGI